MNFSVALLLLLSHLFLLLHCCGAMLLFSFFVFVLCAAITFSLEKEMSNWITLCHKWNTNGNTFLMATVINTTFHRRMHTVRTMLQVVLSIFDILYMYSMEHRGLLVRWLIAILSTQRSLCCYTDNDEKKIQKGSKMPKKMKKWKRIKIDIDRNVAQEEQKLRRDERFSFLSFHYSEFCFVFFSCANKPLWH